MVLTCLSIFRFLRFLLKPGRATRRLLRCTKTLPNKVTQSPNKVHHAEYDFADQMNSPVHFPSERCGKQRSEQLTSQINSPPPAWASNLRPNKVPGVHYWGVNRAPSPAWRGLFPHRPPASSYATRRTPRGPSPGTTSSRASAPPRPMTDRSASSTTGGCAHLHPTSIVFSRWVADFIC